MSLHPRRAEATRKDAHQGPVAAAIEALLSAAVVALAAWYVVARPEAIGQRLAELAPVWAGLLTVSTMLLAGGLLARAFGRAEDAARGWRRAHQAGARADD